MRWSNDDLSGDSPVMTRGLTAADFVVSRHLDDPFVAAEVNDMIDRAEMMGVDLSDPEIMGAWLKDLVNKIKTKIKGIKGNEVPKFQVSTEGGVASVGPEGVNWTDSSTLPTASPAPSVSDKLADMVKNPLVIGAGVGLVALLLLRKRKGGKR